MERHDQRLEELTSFFYSQDTKELLEAISKAKRVEIRTGDFAMG